MGIPKNEYDHLPIPLNGRLILSEDPANIGTNFQLLKNMRYTDTRLKAISGMTKINNTIMNATYFKPRSLYHFRKAQPVESHILVQAYNSAENASRVLLNNNVVPDVNNFETAIRWTDAAGAGRGHFSDAPQGQVIYTNGKESVIWGGNEAIIAGFIHYDNDDATVSKDYTEQLRSTDTDADGVATLDLVSSSYAIDANTMLLLHFDGSYFDSSPTTPHTMTDFGTTIDTTIKKFGSGSLSGAAAGEVLQAADNADFNLSGGAWTIDFWIYATSYPSSLGVIYYQLTVDTSNSFQIGLDASGEVFLLINAAGSPVVSMTTSLGLGNGIVLNRWNHVAVQENGDTYRIYLDGVKVAEVTDTSRAANYTGLVNVGVTGIGDSFAARFDEFRLSNVARYTTDFSPPPVAYATGGSTVSSFYLGATRPLEAFKLYVGTANTATNTMVVYYWDGSAWISVSSLVDGTSSGGKSLAQTGIVSFTNTDGLAKIKEINGTFLYWYKVEIVAAVDATTTLTYATVRPSWQKMKDIWDGVDRSIISFLANKDGTFKDFSTNVLENTYDSNDSGTFAKISPTTNFLQTDEYLYAGFPERMMGLLINIIEDKNNSTAATGLILEYWNGTAWVAVNGLNDSTSENNISFAKSGIISWDAPNKEDEFKYTLIGQKAQGTTTREIPGPRGGTQEITIRAKNAALQKDLPPLYFYRLSFTKALTEVWVYYVSGISAPDVPDGYRYSFQADNRVWLVGKDEEKRNTVKVLTVDAPDVANGDDTAELFFGSDDDATCGAGLYIRTSDTFSTMKVIYKKNEMWGVTGIDPETWRQFQISPGIGCPAPETLRTAKLRGGQILIWQGSQGIYIFDGGSAPIEISGELRNLFEDHVFTDPQLISSYGFVDEFLHEYHWICGGREFTYDLRRSNPAEGVAKWYEIVRGTAKALVVGVAVQDVNGNHYTYGGIDTGYLERLENGTTFDGNDIVAEFQTGDIALYNEDDFKEALIRRIRLVGKVKAVTANSVICTWYGDSGALVSVPVSLAPVRAGSRTFEQSDKRAYGPAMLHSVKLSMTTNNEASGFEPLRLSIAFTEGTDNL